MQCSPTERKINPRTRQFRRRGALRLRLSQTIHDQEVTVIQPNLGGSVLLRAATQFEQDRASEAHADDDLLLRRAPEQTLSRCHGTHDPSPAYRFRFTPAGTFPSAHQGVRRDATLLHRSTAAVKKRDQLCGRAAPCPYAHERRLPCPRRGQGRLTT